MKPKNFISTVIATLGLIFLNLVMATLALVMLNGCQQEITEIIQPAAEDGFTAQTNVSNLIQRTAMLDGSDDDIIDRTSCASLVLPVTIIVNGIEMTVNTKEDLKLVEKILDELDDDDDDIVIRYPVKVILADYSELDIFDDDDFEDLIEQCTDGRFDDVIKCISFKYPISISVYDAQNQLANSFTIESDKALYKLIDDLDDDKYASFNFPITLVLSDGQELIITNHKMLEDIIDDLKDDCDEDELDDKEFVSVLIEGSWIITYFKDDDDDLTAVYKGYLFTFFADGKMTAVKGNLTINGTWDTDDDDGSLELDLDFSDGTVLDELDDDWDVIEFDNTIIKLKDDDDRLIFERPSGDEGDGDEGNLDVLSQILTAGTWKVTFYGDDDDDDTDDFDGYVLEFTNDGSVTGTKDQEVISGAWAISISDNGYQVILNFGDDDPFDDLNDSWKVINFTELKVEMKEADDDDDDDDKLIIERIG